MSKLVVLGDSAFMVVEQKIDFHLHQLDKRPHRSSKTKVSFDKLIKTVEMLYISAGEAHCGALDANGTVFMWGNNAHGECG
jgi:alpha-tubulin suppressor-like RCC1 family protein